MNKKDFCARIDFACDPLKMYKTEDILKMLITNDVEALDSIRAKIALCEEKKASYIKMFDSGEDPEIILSKVTPTN